MEITNILVEKLHTSPLNPRTRSAGKQADMELRHSMNRVGLLNPPTVRVIRQSESYEIIHGNRRVEAARKLKWKYISCFITKMNDQDCEIAATAENMVRTQMHPMDQFEAFENMLTLGESITTIATSFGVKEELVHQRLRLAKLAPVAKKEFRKGAISLDACCALTLGTHTQQRELLKAGIKDTWAIERKLGEGSVNMSVALFDQALYKGKFTTDLFGRDGTETYALDRVEFHSLQFNYMIDKLTEPSDWLFQKISELDAWKIKKIDGKAVTQEYVQDSKKLTKKVKAKLGVIYSLNPLSCKVVSSYWIYKKMPKSKDSTTTTENDTGKSTHTAKQRAILARAHVLMFKSNVKQRGATAMYLHKCAGYNEGSMKAFAKRLIDDNATQVINLIDNVSSLLNEHEPDNAVKLMAYEYKWDLRKNWMPDEEFLKGYTQEALIRIGNEIGYNMKNLPKKSQKVEALIKEFATGTKKADQWLPSE